MTPPFCCRTSSSCDLCATLYKWVCVGVGVGVFVGVCGRVCVCVDVCVCVCGVCVECVCGYVWV